MLFYHQLRANGVCQNRIARKNGGTHRDPRCSLECRDQWAQREADLMIHQLSAVRHQQVVEWGNVCFQADLTLNGYASVRKNFLKLVREWKKKEGFNLEIRGTSEIGEGGRIHFHYVSYADGQIGHENMKKLWEAACGPIPNIVYFQPVKSVEAVAKYIFKDTSRVRQRKEWIWLFDKNGFRICWGTMGFFRPDRKSVQKALNQRTP